MDKFNEAVSTYTDKFQQDDTYSLITRLRHNVIKTGTLATATSWQLRFLVGIKLICLSYSRISLKDIAAKLSLDDALDAEYIVAKVCCYDNDVFHSVRRPSRTRLLRPL